MLMLAILVSCSKTDNLDTPLLGLGGDTWVKGPIDDWLYENFTQPYNIEVKYRWDASEVSLNNTLVPPREEFVIPVMDMVKEGWIDVYTEEVGEDFIKEHAPRQYLLVGSPQYNTSGTITLGEAEGGAKVTLYRVNWFDKSDRALIKRMLKTIQHEFSHILHQKVMYPAEFELITPGDYNSTWNQLSNADAWDLGFITPYASSTPNEDFAELVSVMLTEGYDGFEAIVNGISNQDAVNKIRQKQDIVVTYFMQVWNIDLFSLQQKAEEAINRISPLPPPPPPPALHTLFGSTYSAIRMNVSESAEQSQVFMDVYNNTAEALLADAGRILNFFRIFHNGSDQILLRINYNSSTGTTFNAQYIYDTVMDEDGNITFSNPRNDDSYNGNGVSRATALAPLVNYLNGRQFNFRWYNDSSADQVPAYGAYYNLANEQDFFYGILE